MAAVLPSRCRRYLLERGLVFDECEDGGEKGVVLRQFALPPQRFEATSADILILLPGGYPDTPPDMFYTLPWLCPAGSNTYPKAADQPRVFAGQNWQRWSRHNNEWRPGVDGIWTMMKRVTTALEQAS